MQNLVRDFGWHEFWLALVECCVWSFEVSIKPAEKKSFNSCEVINFFLSTFLMSLQLTQIRLVTINKQGEWEQVGILWLTAENSRLPDLQAGVLRKKTKQYQLWKAFVDRRDEPLVYAVCVFFQFLSDKMSALLPASINPGTLTKWRSIQISSFLQQSMVNLSRTLIGILYSACSLVVLMALNLTVYSFNKGAARCLGLSKCSLRESELHRKEGRHKEGQN